MSPRGDQEETQELRDELVAALKTSGAIKSYPVERAFARVPRHRFVPNAPLHAVYDDRALATKTRAGISTSSSSQPAIMAIMLEQLALRRGMSVLEIGAGTGYNAALVSEIVRAQGRVVSVDIQADVAAAARKHVTAYKNVRVITADGGRGRIAGTPFDRMIVTAGCWYVPEAWLHHVVEGGVLVLPLRLNGSAVSIALRRHGESLRGVSARPCGFMPMQGVSGRPAYRRLSAGEPAVYLQSDAPISLPRLRALLSTTPRRMSSETLSLINPVELMHFATFHALQGDPIVMIGSMTSGQDAGLCDVDATSLCLVGTSAVSRGKLIVYGSDAMREAFERNVHAWVAAGKPTTDRLRVDITRGESDELDEMPRPIDGGRYVWARRGLRFDARYAAR